MNTKAARQRADQGIVSSAEHAGAQWLDECSHYLRWYSRLMLRKRQAFSIEEFRNWAYSKGLPVPPEQRSFGAVTQRALRDGVIEATGIFTPSNSSNRSPKMQYFPRDMRRTV